ncbi:MAG: ABC transporter ATP-binding protein [Thermoleophilia bacterium]|nr:ABC transporter ATP-binding protein [Thermoleophilia bacterium]
MTDAMLEAHGLEYGYRTRSVLRGVDLQLHRGEVVALLGPNGSGKTTLMKLLVGLGAPEAGTTRGPDAQEIGWVPQGGAVYQRLTVRENLLLFARLPKLPGDTAALAVATARDAQLEPWLDTPGSDLSGGLRQRLNVAVGLLGDPQLLVLDEPTTGVDLEHRAAMFRVLRQRADAGGSLLVSTHSIEEAMSFDRAVVLVSGRIAYSGSIAGIADAAPDVAIDDTLGLADPISRGLLRLWAADAEVAS